MRHVTGTGLSIIAFFVFCTLNIALSRAEAAETIRINGSGSGLVMMKPLIAAYRKAHPDIRIEIEKPLGSSGATKALLAGALDIAVSSKPLKPEEQSQSAVSREYGKTPLAIVAGNNRSRTDISTKELEDIYSGRSRTWPDGEKIRLILRPESDIDTKILGGLSSGMNEAIVAAHSQQGMVVAITDTESVEAMIKIPGALGATGLTSILVDKPPLHILTLNGIRPTLAALANKSYPLVKEIRFITAKHTSPGAIKFIDFICSTKGRKIAEKSGVLVSAGGK